MSDIDSLAARCANAIDTTWFSSEYWERKGGYLTLIGWQQIKRDAQARIEGAYSVIRKVDLLMPEIDTKIAELLRVELEDIEADE